MGTGKRAVMLGAAVLVALLASTLVYARLEKRSHAQVGAAQTQAAVVAAIDLPWGAVIGKDAVKVVPFLKKSLPAGAFAEPSAVEGRTLIGPLKAGELVLESRLAPTSLQTGGVAAIITPKKRAMAVRVDKVVGVSGFIRPGHRVDVLVTLSQMGESHRPVTKTVLENVLVLAAGGDLEKGARPEKPSQVDVITLEVTPEDGEKLALAATEGKLQLALRNAADNADVMTRGSTFPALLASYGAGGLEGATPQRPQKTQRARAAAQGVGTSRPAGAWTVHPQFSVELVKGTVLSSVRFDRRE
jgi:pilus assembly protein CpaB